jgi:hypothetical protein
MADPLDFETISTVRAATGMKVQRRWRRAGDPRRNR